MKVREVLVRAFSVITNLFQALNLIPCIFHHTMACMSGYVPVRMGQVGALHDDLLGPGRDRLRTLQRRQLLLPLAPQPPEHGQGEIVETITRNMLS